MRDMRMGMGVTDDGDNGGDVKWVSRCRMETVVK